LVFFVEQTTNLRGKKMHDLATMKRLNEEHSKRYFENQRKDQVKLLNALTARKSEDEKMINDLKQKLGM